MVGKGKLNYFVSFKRREIRGNSLVSNELSEDILLKFERKYVIK